MADENQSDMEEAAEAAADELRETAERVEDAADSAAADAATLADEAVVEYEATVVDEAIVTEPAVLTDTAAGGEEAFQTVEEQVVETYPESAIATVPDQASVAEEELDEAWRMADPTGEVEYVAPSPPDELGVVERSETVVAEAVVAEAVGTETVVTETVVADVSADDAVIVEAAAEAPEEAFSTLQAVTLAFLVLLNIIVIGLGIWQVSLYFGWL